METITTGTFNTVVLEKIRGIIIHSLSKQGLMLGQHYNLSKVRNTSEGFKIEALDNKVDAAYLKENLKQSFEYLPKFTQVGSFVDLKFTKQYKYFLQVK